MRWLFLSIHNIKDASLIIFLLLLMTFANSLDPDRIRHVRHDLNKNCLFVGIPKLFFIVEKNMMTTKSPSKQKFVPISVGNRENNS